MSDLTREQRIDRQELDNGDPEETVIVQGSGSHNGNRTTYHADPDCSHFKRDTKRKMTRRAAKRRWLKPCIDCVLDGRGGK